MKDYFQKISDKLFNSLENHEILVLNFDAEKTDFVRFNHSKIRQAGNVNQATLCLLYTSPSPRDVEESRMPSSA